MPGTAQMSALMWYCTNCLIWHLRNTTAAWFSLSRMLSTDDELSAPELCHSFYDCDRPLTLKQKKERNEGKRAF